MGAIEPSSGLFGSVGVFGVGGVSLRGGSCELYEPLMGWHRDYKDTVEI